MADYRHNPSSGSQILRARWHDYRDRGFYMLTMVTEGRARAFGQLKGEHEDSARIELSPLGKVLEKSILAIPDYYPEVEIIDHVVMEDHCHICLLVNETMRKHLGAVVGTIKTETTKARLHEKSMEMKKLCMVIPADARDRRRQSERIEQVQRWLANGAAEPQQTGLHRDALAIARMLADNSSIPAGGVGDGSAVICHVPVLALPPLWAQGYHNRIVTRYGQIAAQKAYIRRNPGRLWAKRHADRALTKVVDVHVPISLSLAQRLKDAAMQWDQRRDVLHSQFSQRHDGRHYAESYLELTQKFLRKKIIKRESSLREKATSLVASGSAAGSEAAGKAKGSAAGSKAAGMAASEPLQPFLKLRVCGNRDLLFSGRPMVRVRISRSITEAAFREEAERILALCEREGAVAVSPFRSWSEKMVLRMIRANGYDHVIVYGESMWEGWKPQDGSTADMKSQYVPEWAKGWLRHTEPNSGADHGDLAEVFAGRCVFIALWADRPKGERAGKADCEIMNEIGIVMEMNQSKAE